MPSQILILGAGGHGAISLVKLFTTTNYNFCVYYNTADWGGSYGLWGRLLENNDNELNKKLHNQILPVLPFADPSKLINYLFEKRGILARSFLDFRSDNPTEHLSKVNQIATLLHLSNQQKQLFQKYLTTALDYYLLQKTNLKYNKQFCLGYVVHSFVFWIMDGMDGWNKFFHKINILPSNVFVDFTAKHRQTLVGIDLSLNECVGEDNIDSHTSPILPSSLHFQNPLTTRGKAPPKTQFIKNLQTSDWIIIPNGSIANWLSVVNYPEIKKQLINKPIIWLTNPYRNKNELINPNYYLYLLENHISVIAMASKTTGHNKKFHNVLLQDKNGKYNVDSVALEITKIIDQKI